MPRFNVTGWQRISKPCTECGIDIYYIKPLEGGKVDTKQFHKRNCPSLPITKEWAYEKPKITDVEYKEVADPINSLNPITKDS